MLFIQLVVVSLVFLQFFSASVEAKWNFDEYKCAICDPTVKLMSKTKQSFEDACLNYFPKFMCENFHLVDSKKINLELPARDNCVALNYCIPKDYSGDISDMDVRVVKALGSRGYDKIRLSIISNTTIASEHFSYTQPFKYRWTNKYLNTGIVSVTPGQKTVFNINGKQIAINLPAENAGVRGAIIADPCFTSEWIQCLYQNKYQTFAHLTTLLNAMNANDDLSYWQILGDNFYDQEGDASSTWFGALTDASKSKIMATVPGNHDFWVNSSPTLSVPWDQYGNGFMQFYAQDTMSAAANAATPYDFTVDPDGSNPDVGHGGQIAAASNYFFYNKVGNVAFIGYSGAHTFSSMQSYFEEACTWAASTNPSVVLLLGHWNNAGDGCEVEATTPATYKEISALPQCAPIASKLKYFMGHKHCNYVTETNVGFMVGGQGMSDHDCQGDFGIPIVDTTNGRFQVYYFPIAHASDYDNYQSILNCVQANGVSGCYHLATKWADVPLN